MAQLRALVALCRELGVVKLTWEGTEILMGPEPPKPEAKPEEGDPRAGKRDHYRTLLGRGVTDKELDMLP